jgi:hypothetical protein
MRWGSGGLLLLALLPPAGAGDSVLAFARREMRSELPPQAAIPITEAERAAQDRAARAAAEASLGLVDVVLRLRTKHGAPVPGVAALALHERFDATFGPAVTDGRGEATLRLPRGPWRVDLATHEPQPGSLVFARVRFDVRGPGREEVALGHSRQVRFRSRIGDARAAHAVTLGWPDLSFHRAVDALQGELDLLTADDAPMVLQAVRRPDEGDGYVLRATIGAGTTIVETDPERATEHVFRGSNVRRLEVRYASADALPLDLSFASAATSRVRLAGLDAVVVAVDVNAGGRRYGFFPRPFALDGAERAFSGAPPFAAGVGHVLNGREQYGERGNSVSFRVFLTTPEGLLLRGDGAYSVSWEQLLDGQARASGTARPAEAVWTAPIDPKRYHDLRYRLRIRGPGENRRAEVAGHGQTAEVLAGKVRTWCFPEVEPNARMLAAAVGIAVRAYEDTCPFRKSRVDIERSIHMPLPVAGMGGYAGDAGWMWLPEGDVYGFCGTSFWNGLLCHELGHVFHYGHNDPGQTRVMVQAGRRAARRQSALRPGMAREPEGDRFRALFEAVTRGELRFETPPDEALEPVRDAPGDGVLVPNLELTGDDQVFTWFYRSAFGEAADHARRDRAAAWSWWLTLRGYTDEEIQIAMYSRAAGAPLAWLARLRGTVVHDHRIVAAMAELEANDSKLPDDGRRGQVLAEWRGRPQPGDDLEDLARRARAEIGHRHERVLALLRIARERLARGEAAGGEAALLDALVEARLGGEDLLHRALREAAPIWAAR